MNRMKKLLASILAVSTCISMLACGVSATDVEFQTNPQTVTVGSETENVDLTTGWRYLDNNTDPAGDSTAEGYDRLSWTKADYDDSSWNVAARPIWLKARRHCRPGRRMYARCTAEPVY